ncbi:MAG: hypothetical protein J6S28_04165 [Clostridia bacterium]|nr:hypothetical protein [Clostridia bacterium]
MIKREHRGSIGSLGFGLLGAGCILLLLFYADSAVKAVLQGLSLCKSTVIPSLFPFMVASELLVRSGGAAAVGNLLSRPMQHLLGVPGAAACPIVLGALCGFPTGARAAAALYDEGALTRKQCTRLMTFINNPSSAYTISAVGTSLLGSRRLGLVLWVVSLACSLGTALLTRPLFGDDEQPTAAQSQPVRMGADVFTGSISAAAQSMLTVCAYVLFFSAVLGAAQDALCVLSLPPFLNAVLYGVLELSGGVTRAAQLPDLTQSAMLCAALCSWSGLSVMCQIMTACRGRGFDYKPYLLAKAAQALISAALTGLAVRYLLPHLPPENVHAGLLLPQATALLFAKAVNLTFAGACAWTLVKNATARMHRAPAFDIYCH